MKDINQTLEFDAIIKKILPYSVSNCARERIMKLEIESSLASLKQKQADCQQAMEMIRHFDYLPLQPFDTIDLYLQKASKGGILFGEDFLAIMRVLSNGRVIETYVQQELPSCGLVTYMKQFEYLKELYRTLETCIDTNGQIQDGASASLRKIRQEKRKTEAAIRSKMIQLQKQYKEYLTGEPITSRQEHFVLPVKVAYKNRVPGTIHAFSASGQTIFIEPSAILSYYQQMVQLEESEKREIQAILLRLSNLIRDHHTVLSNNEKIAVDLDEIFAKARYGISISGCMPNVSEQYDQLQLKEARHPLIDPEKVVSNTIVLEQGKRIVLISGSNTGGKTVILKTVGLLSAMALMGLPIPCYEATVPFFDTIFVDLGDEQSIAQSLSTFSSHMQRLIVMTKQVTDKSLLILDEIGSGTDPQEGQSIAQAILEYFYTKRAMIIASTHYAGLKQFAKEKDYVQVAAVAFDQESMQPTYHLLPGNVGQSYAIEIAKRLGLPESIVTSAMTIKKENLSQTDILLERLEKELLTVQSQKEQLAMEKQEAAYFLMALVWN